MSLVEVRKSLEECQTVLTRFMGETKNLEAIQAASELMIASLREGGKIISCGNGGSMCDAMHFAEELSGKFRKERAPLAAVAISDPGHITCVGNDFGFEHIFSHFVASQGRHGDVLLAISTSGKSANVLKALEAAKGCGMKVVALTGKPNSPIGARSDVEISAVGNAFSDRTQELHIKIIHIIIESIERALFPENY